MNSFAKICVVAVALAGAVLVPAAAARAQGADVGLVNQLAGEVGYAPAIGATGKVQAFMKVREGDRFTLPAGAQLRIVYFDTARQERWVGPASLRAAKGTSEALSGKPAEVTTLPGSAAPRIARVPDLMQNARLGGIQVRGTRKAPPLNADDQSNVAAARVTYEQMRKDFPSDDITPELFLASALHEYMLYDQMKPVVDEMKRKQPDSEDVKTLSAWIATRAGR
jgi:hypothetical protein